MLFSVELINLILYCVQQLGVALGLGAQTIMLVAYISAMRDGNIDDYEAQFLRATRGTLWVSFVLMIVSGLGITLLHILAGESATILTPAYLFKWVLIAVVIALTATLQSLPETITEGLLGGTWYALFLVHILAPVTTWFNLVTLWVVWLIGFNLVWYVIVFATRERKAKETPAAKPVPIMAPVIPQPIAPPAQPATLVPVEKLQPIILETVPAPAAVIPPGPVPQPIAVQPPVPAAQLQQIKTDPAPISMQRAAPPVEKLPAGIATDTPFLPQVPPLQPIPVIPPTTPVAAPSPATIPVAAPAATLQTSPEVKLGLNVMPKSPDQLK